MGGVLDNHRVKTLTFEILHGNFYIIEGCNYTLYCHLCVTVRKDIDGRVPVSLVRSKSID